jgi:prepilin-type N-terminal cleavage/methylation domain-containing protein
LEIITFGKEIQMNANKKMRRNGFTIVELLTVMGVIAILISLLVPALALVRDFSKEIQQKAQFHSIEVGLEMYKTEFGGYPPSNDNFDLYNPSKNDINDPTPYGGANKLAEAMVGLDMLGFHAKSDFRSDGINIRYVMSVPDPFAVYHADIDDPGFETAEENVQARKGPYLDLENANVFEMQDLYSTLGSFRTGVTAPSKIEQSLVLCDEFIAKRHLGKKTGMPILYYKARRMYTQQDSSVIGNDIDDDIYYYPDNQNLLELGMADGSGMKHVLGDLTDDHLDFENMILNEQVTSVYRPYKADSYILISAGKDAMYGTPDDMFNFEKKE